MTEQQFKKKLIIRITATALLFALGGALYWYGIAGHRIVEPYAFKGKYIYSFIGGIVGGGLAVAIKLIITLVNPKLFKERYVAENDERNRQISLRAWAWTGYISVFAILISTFFLPEQVIKYVLCLMCVPLAVYVVVYKILQIKM